MGGRCLPACLLVFNVDLAAKIVELFTNAAPLGMGSTAEGKYRVL